MENKDAFISFEQTCVNALMRREYSQHELRAKGKDIPDEVIEQVLAMLVEKDWQSDRRFCEEFTASHVNRGDGPLKIRQGLRQRGIDDSLITQALDEVDWRRVARSVYDKKYREAAISPKERAKRQRFLAQRGFVFDDIHYVINHDTD